MVQPHPTTGRTDRELTDATTNAPSSVRCWTCNDVVENTAHPQRPDGTPDFCSLECLRDWMPPRSAWPDDGTSSRRCAECDTTFATFASVCRHADRDHAGEVYQ